MPTDVLCPKCGVSPPSLSECMADDCPSQEIIEAMFTTDTQFSDPERQLLLVLVTKAAVEIDRLDLPDAYEELLAIRRKLEGTDTVVFSRQRVRRIVR